MIEISGDDKFSKIIAIDENILCFFSFLYSTVCTVLYTSRNKSN